MFINGISDKNDISIDIYIKFLELELLLGGFKSIILDYPDDFEFITNDFKIFSITIKDQALFNEVIKESNSFTVFSLKHYDKSLNLISLSLKPHADALFKLESGYYEITDRYVNGQDYDSTTNDYKAYLRYGYYILLSLQDYWDNIPIEVFDMYNKLIRSARYNFKEYLKDRSRVES